MLLFLDSGAFSAWTNSTNITLSEYIEFIRQNADSLEVYACLDDITDPEKTWKNQEIMEKEGLHPLPVYHVDEPDYFLDRAMSYDYFAVGGMALKGSVNRRNRFNFVFEKVCPEENNFLPTHKVHGFGLASPDLLVDYPWFSVDSITGDSVILIKDCGRIRTETIESFYHSAGRYANVETTSLGHSFKRLENIETYTLDKEGKGKWCPVTKVLRHEVGKSIYDVSAVQGFSVSVTGDHSCFIHRGKQKLCVPTKEITTFDKMIKGHYTDSFGNLEEIVVSIDVPSYEKTNVVNNSNRCTVKRPKKISFTKEFLEFCGLWIADGHFSLSPTGETKSIGISSANDEECRKVLQTVANSFGRELFVKTNDVDSTINSQELLNIMKELEFISGSFKKEIPWWIFELSRKDLCSFLRGYFSGDGTVTNHIEYTTISVSLLYGIHFLLNKLGINPSISRNCNRNPGGTISDLIGKTIFYKEINFLQSYKNDKLEKIIKGKIPRGKKSEQVNQEVYLNIKHIRKEQARKTMVYDLEVPGEQSFLANGLLVHNTTSWVMYGRYGIILVPRSINGRLRYDKAPEVITISSRSKSVGKEAHYRQLGENAQKVIRNYCESKGFPIGRTLYKSVTPNYILKENEKWTDRKTKDRIEKIVDVGLCCDGEMRDRLNLWYFLDLEKYQPKWPWPWKLHQEELFPNKIEENVL